MEKIRAPEAEQGSEKWKITGAGLPDACKDHVSIDKFNYNETFKGKLRPKHVKGGIILIDTPFTIR